VFGEVRVRPRLGLSLVVTLTLSVSSIFPVAAQQPNSTTALSVTRHKPTQHALVSSIQRKPTSASQSVTVEIATKLGRSRDAEGLKRIIATKDAGLIASYADGFAFSPEHVAAVNASKPDTLPADIESVIVKHYDAFTLGVLRFRFLSNTKYSTRALFDRLYADCKNREYFDEILSTDQPDIEEPLLQLLSPRPHESPAAAAQRARELLSGHHRLLGFFLGRHYSAAAPTLISAIIDTPPSDPAALNIEFELFRMQDRTASTAVLARVKKLGTYEPGPDVQAELDRILQSLAGLPVSALPEYRELQDAVPPHVTFGERQLLLGLMTRWGKRELPYRSEALSLTQEQCEATRLQGLDGRDREETACFGLVNARFDVLNACLRYPIDFNQRCPGRTGRPEFGRLPLELALDGPYEMAIEDLISHGVNPRAPGNYRSFWVACLQHHNDPDTCKRILRFLVAHGMDPNHPSLIWDVRDPSQEDALVMLLEAGADINAPSDSPALYGDCTSLDIAYRDHERGRMEMLERHGGRQTEKCLLDHKLSEALATPRALLFYGACAILHCSFH